MSGLELNKLFAAVLCACITVMLVGYVAETIVAPEALEQDAVAIEAPEGGASGAVAGAPKLPDPIMALLAEADTAKGAKISKSCAACHSFDKGGPVKQGPSLWGIVGHSKGSIAGFAYSDDMKTKGGIWDYDSLNHFLTKPKKYISGTKMNFAGIKKPEDRAAIIAWLREQSDAPYALPTDADIAAEQAAFAPPAEEASEEGAEESAPADATHH